MELGKRIISLRKERHMTQEDFAEVCNVTRQTVSNWENGKNYPDLDTLVFISDYFDISLDILLKGDRKMVSNITNEQKRSKYSTAAVIILVVIILGELILSNVHVSVGSENYNVEVVRIEMSDFTEQQKNEDGSVFRVVNIPQTPISEAMSLTVDEEWYKDFLANDGGYCVLVKAHLGTLCWVDKGEKEKTLSLNVEQSLSEKILPEKMRNQIVANPCLTVETFDSIYDANIAKSESIEKANVWKRSI